MPELPEVEAVARALRPLVAGQRLRRIRVLHSVAVRPQTARHLRQAEGARIAGVERRGKYLLLRLGPGPRGWLAMHFRLDGQLVWFPSGRASGHVDVLLELPRGALGFVDRRHFGRVVWLMRPEELPGLRALGVEALSPAFTPHRLRGLLAKSRQPLKLFLLDQGRIAGLGNIYSCEALWRARLHPRRRAHRTSPAEARRLHKAVVGVLRRALECCLDPPPDFRDPARWFTGLERILRVYGREGRPCRRCRSRIRRIEQGGRSSFYCARCQR
jgi:formamidopyrimidine-DNA glycosylase